ncbi:hypothetical protein R1flu_028303 [Riccia fluitans]|uniref:EEF1A lysine methyltransferase 4 n=1 Tax=Riccia fluitans TaxID=41844 RepID=A0ABD1XLV0_9MARC
MAEHDRKDDGLPLHTALYLEPTYWNDRFAREDHYEWFKDYTHFRHLILANVKPTDQVLEVGCGNSQMGIEMYKDGITQITRTDLSPVAVKRMEEKSVALAYKGIRHQVADMLDLPFEDETFDVVIEKGTVDVLFVDSGDPWNPSQDVVNRVEKMLKETHRVLTPNGIFISIAFGQPHFRRPFFEAKGLTWTMKWDTFGDSFHYFFYKLRKGTKDDNQGPNVPLPLQEKVTFDLEHEFMDDEDFLRQSSLGDNE